MMIVKKTLKICRFILISVLAVILFLNVVSVVRRVVFKEQMPLIFGFGNAVIVSGSMEPTILVGDVIVIRKQNDYDVDDIVMFKANSYITHRIVERTETGYITQGDANNARDKEIEGSSVVGKVIKILPKVGNVVLFLQNPLYMAILLLLLFAAIELPQLRR